MACEEFYQAPPTAVSAGVVGRRRWALLSDPAPNVVDIETGPRANGGPDAPCREHAVKGEDTCTDRGMS
ncbi:hypothetical protein GCM10010246_80000 [Streptomyces cuspidosporus]|uniref:Uncharacterized protein n=1 Tax=Streptomyces cuspidosporus TaxID=66882 RepID=A0ABP5UCE2_9ACTN